MQRRAVLRSLTAVSAAAAAGLAGCNTGNGNEAECQTPNGDLQSALPRGQGYTNPSVDTNNNATEVGGATSHVLGSYITNDENYLFIIAEYDSNNAAETAARTEENWTGFGYPVTGYLVVGKYVYVAMGPDRESVTDLMATAPPLGEQCVNQEMTIF